MRRKYLLRSAPSGALEAMTMRAGRTETAFASASRMNASDNAAAAAGVIEPISLVLTWCSIGSRQNTISAGRVLLTLSTAHLIVFGRMMFIGTPRVFLMKFATDVMGFGKIDGSLTGPLTWK